MTAIDGRVVRRDVDPVASTLAGNGTTETPATTAALRRSKHGEVTTSDLKGNNVAHAEDLVEHEPDLGFPEHEM